MVIQCGVFRGLFLCLCCHTCARFNCTVVVDMGIRWNALPGKDKKLFSLYALSICFDCIYLDLSGFRVWYLSRFPFMVVLVSGTTFALIQEPTLDSTVNAG